MDLVGKEQFAQDLSSEIAVPGMVSVARNKSSARQKRAVNLSMVLAN